MHHTYFTSVLEEVNFVPCLCLFVGWLVVVFRQLYYGCTTGDGIANHQLLREPKTWAMEKALRQYDVHHYISKLQCNFQYEILIITTTSVIFTLVCIYFLFSYSSYLIMKPKYMRVSIPKSGVISHDVRCVS